MADDPIKDFLNRMPYGFYAITSRSDSDVNAMVANWITQVSFKPRRIAVGLQKKAYSHGIIEDGRVFALNLFLEADRDYLMPFTKGRSKKPDKMTSAVYTTAPETGCPILEGAAAHLECKVVQIIDISGDHDVVIGEPIGAGIIKAGQVSDSLSLVKLGWSYAG
jgi:flavin reductase (DIM6/NTAB) family NADH-FMN oxidoreductase RutF